MAHRQPNGPVAIAAHAAGFLLWVACAGPGSYGPGSDGGARIPPLTTSSILAPVPSSADAELARLERLGDNPSTLLRRAYILMKNGESRRSLQLDNQVLYGLSSPSPAEEAMALYLRSTAYMALGEEDSAARDRDRALELALDEDLRRRLRASAPEPPVSTPTPEPVPTSNLAIQPRSAWRASPERPSRLNPMGRVYRLTIHHSALTLDNTSTIAAADSIQRIQRNHQNHPLNYGDIGYHFVIDPAGQIWAARDIRWQGAHAQGSNNRGNVGVCLLGNFGPGLGGQTPTPAQVRTLRTFTTQLCNEYQIPVGQIYTHQEMVATECPGTNLQVVVDRMRREIRLGK